MVDLGQCLTEAVARRRRLAAMSFGARLAQAPRMAMISAAVLLLHKTGRALRHRATTFWGAGITVALPEAVSSEIARFGYIEEPVARALIAHVRPGDTVFDVGGHFGFFSLLAAELAGKNGHVHTFEPIPGTCTILKENLRGKAVTVNNAAVWHQADEIVINDFGLALSAFNSVRMPRLKDGGRAVGMACQVPAIALDDYARQTGVRPAFVKIDAESAEDEVLRGMTELLRTVRPVICLEIGDLGVADAVGSTTLVGRMIDHGYSPMEWAVDRFVPHQPQQRYGHLNLLFVPNA